MASIILTNKTAAFGVLANIPSADVATTCTAVNPSFYTASIPAMSPTVSAGEYIIIRMSLQNAGGATVRTVRIIKANGDVLLTFAPVTQPALPLVATTIYSARTVVGNPADWVNVLIQVSSGTAGDSVVINANTVVFGFAESCNLVDETLVKRNVTNLYFMTMQPPQEAILGKVDSASGQEFTAVEVNGLVSGFIWSSNSGNTLYSWSGSSISIGN
jgi:hypothetical protein